MRWLSGLLSLYVMSCTSAGSESDDDVVAVDSGARESDGPGGRADSAIPTAPDADLGPSGPTDPPWPADEPLPPEFDFPPFVTMPVANQIVISWRTVGTTMGRVHYGTTPDYGATIATDAAGTLHHVGLGVLTSATAYYYEVEVDGTSARRKGVFVTPGATRWRFAHLGEFHAAGEIANVANFAEEIRAFRPHLVVESGDMLDDGDEELDWTAYFQTSAPWISNVIILPVGSNHVDGFFGNSNFKDIFVLPNNERWYTTRYGQAEFFTLDSTWGLESIDILFVEPAWVKDQTVLAHDGIDDPSFVIGAWHYPACSSTQASRFADRIWVQANFIQNFKDGGGIDLALVAHDKYYERSTIAGGIVHVQSNIGKLSPGDPGDNHPDCTAEVTRTDVRSVVLATVEDATLSASVIDGTGSEIDSFTIVK